MAEVESIAPAAADISAPAVAPVIPLELVDKCIGSQVWVVMRGDRGEFIYSMVLTKGYIV